MPKFRVRFDAMLLCKMSLSIGVLMPAKIYIIYFVDWFFRCFIYIHCIYIRLKIKPNSARIRF